MSPDRRVGDAERRGDLRYAADLGDGQQDAQLGRRQLECLADDLRGRRGDQGSPADEQGGGGRTIYAGTAARA